MVELYIKRLEGESDFDWAERLQEHLDEVMKKEKTLQAARIKVAEKINPFKRNGNT